MTEWNSDLEKRILKRSRFTLVFRMLWILLVVLFVYVIYMFVVNFTADRLHVGNKHMYYSSLALEWKVPNVRGDLSFTRESVNTFGTHRLSYNLVKRIGLKEVVLGEAHVTKRLANQLSTIDYIHPGLQHLDYFTFFLPKDPRTNERLSAHENPDVWETLAMLPEGTVAELAFSTPKLMKPEEVLNQLRDYDIHILWMPLYTGEFVSFTPYSYGKSDDVLMVGDVIGLTGGIDRDEQYHESLQYHYLDQTSLKDSQQLMLKNMAELLEQSTSYYEYFLGLGHLQEKYDYLEDEGFLVYGAVVTGPVKELLKLQQSEIVRGEQLGEIELWNWELNRDVDRLE